MTRKKPDLSPERQLLTHMIVSDKFLHQVAPLCNPQHLSASYSRMVAGWVLEYYSHFKASPGKDIQSIFQAKSEELGDEDLVENIADFLVKLSQDWEEAIPQNVDYAVRRAKDYLKLRSLEYLKEVLDIAISENNLLRAEQLVATYKRVESLMGAGVSVFRDTGAVIRAFLEEDEHLFTFPGALGQVSGRFNRGDFIAFIAPQKRGKTWMLWYTAETAASAGLKVLFVSFEMTEKQMLRRGWQSLSGTAKGVTTINLPYFEEIEYDGETRYAIRHREEERPPMDASLIEEQQARLRRIYRGGDIRIICIPSGSAGVDDIESHLDNLAHYDNWVADVIVVDYADIIQPPPKLNEYRHQIDGIWKGLRRLSQKRNILGVTASQANKAAFNEDITEEHQSEDSRKFGHVTAMLAINQTKAEAEENIIRIAQIGVREGRRVFDQAVCLQTLDIGRPVLDSRLRKEVILPTDEENGERKPAGRRRR